MKAKYNIYILKTEDTLLSIAKELDKNPSEVAGFHNIFVTEDNYIGKTFPPNLKELYVPLSVSVKALEKVPKVNFDYESYLTLKPKKQKLIYDVKKEFTEKSRYYELEFRIELKFLKKHGANFLFEINKLNRKKSVNLDSILYDLLAELDQVFYPMQLLISKEGSLEALYNYKDILKNWSDLKPQIQEEYEGKIIESYLEYYENTLLDKTVLQKMLFRDTFLNTYFNSLYGNYTSSFNFEKKYNFPLNSKVRNIEYFVKQSINPYFTSENKIEVEIFGTSVDRRTQLDYESNLDDAFFLMDDSNPLVEGNFEAKYELNPETNGIENILLLCDLQLEHQKEIKVAINLVEN